MSSRTSPARAPSRRAWLGVALGVPTALALVFALAPTGGAKPAAAPSTVAVSTAAPAPSVSPTEPDPTGTFLETLLVTDVPSTFTPVRSATLDSGDDPQFPNIVPAPARPDCAVLDGTGFLTVTGVTGVAFAQSTYVDKQRDEIAQEIDAYASVDAMVAMDRLRDVIAACPTFPVTAGKVTGTVVVTPVPLVSLGDDAVAARMTAKEFLGGTTIVAVRVGDTVVSALYNDTVGTYDNGDILDLVGRLIANVQAAG